jgi:hypothetical protein
MSKLLLFLLLPSLVGAQAVGQAALRLAITRDNATATKGLGLVGTYGVAQTRNIELALAAGVIRSGGQFSESAGVDLVYVVPTWAQVTPYVGVEYNATHLVGTTIPGYVLFAGVSLNRLGHMRKIRGADTPAGWIVEGRVGQLHANGRYTELDLGYAP